eukprot:1571043-Pleurochrysis_carterae.AAC.1
MTDLRELKYKAEVLSAQARLTFEVRWLRQQLRNTFDEKALHARCCADALLWSAELLRRDQILGGNIQSAAECLFALGKQLNADGEFAAAGMIFSHAFLVQPKVAYLLSLANMQMKSGQYHFAAELYRRVAVRAVDKENTAEAVGRRSIVHATEREVAIARLKLDEVEAQLKSETLLKPDLVGVAASIQGGVDNNEAQVDGEETAASTASAHGAIECKRLATDLQSSQGVSGGAVVLRRPMDGQSDWQSDEQMDDETRVASGQQVDGQMGKQVYTEMETQVDWLKDVPSNGPLDECAR